MIPFASQRANGQDLATHLQNAQDNELVEVAHVRGAIAKDLHGAFAEWEVQAHGLNRCRNYLYSLSINPDQPQGEAAIPADILRLSLESLRDHLSLAAGARRADGQAFRAYPAYVDSVKVNVVAGLEGDLHLIGVYVGLAAACYELGNFCFAQGTMFPDIGDPAAELSPAPLLDNAPGFWMRDQGKRLETAAFIAQGQTYLPRDPQRQTTALLLAVLMLRAVWFHELAHGLNGHTGWARRVHGLTCLHEVGDPATPRCDVPEAHLLEYDADQSALMLACKVQTEGAENITGLLAMPLTRRLHLTQCRGMMP